MFWRILVMFSISNLFVLFSLNVQILLKVYPCMISKCSYFYRKDWKKFLSPKAPPPKKPLQAITTFN